MSTLLNNYTVFLAGDQYTIVSDEGYEVVEKLTQKVNDAIDEIAKKTGSTDAKRCAVLAAIKFAHQLQKLEYDLQVKNNEESLLIEKINQQLSHFVS